MLVVGNRPTDRVRFYQANFEHASSEANMEVRDAHNVEIFVSYTLMCPSCVSLAIISAHARMRAVAAACSLLSHAHSKCLP
jgi:hypothetical protein